MQFMLEGGFAMWPILIFGIVGLAAGVRFAIAPDLRWLAFVGAMWVTLLVTVGHATILDLGLVMGALRDEGRIPDAVVVRVLFEGLKEATRPAALGGTFLSVTTLAVAIGIFRKRFWENLRTYP